MLHNIFKKVNGARIYLPNQLEREIDQLAYKLYSLTEEEIKVIEGETS